MPTHPIKPTTTKHGGAALEEPPEAQSEPPTVQPPAAPPPMPPATSPATPKAAPVPAAGVTPLAAAPITLRSTYPPGQPAMSAPPRLLGKTPTTVNQIMFPDGIKATHFQGPLVSGPTPGVQGAAGSALLALTLQVDYTMGNFSIPIQFPGGSILRDITAVTTTAFSGTTPPTIGLGSQVNLSDVATVTVPAHGAAEAPVAPLTQMPLWDAVAPLSPFQVFLTVGGNTGMTAGVTIVMVTYFRLAAPWSPPASDYSRPGNF